MKITSLHDLYVHELRVLFDAEKQLAEGIPDLVAAATAEPLKKAFEAHLIETRQHVERLRQILGDDIAADTSVECACMRSLIEECRAASKRIEDDDVRDAALITTGQRIEHWEIAGYGCVRTFAILLGEAQAARLLQTTLDEEALADLTLTGLAEAMINPAADKSDSEPASRSGSPKARDTKPPAWLSGPRADHGQGRPKGPGPDPFAAAHPAHTIYTSLAGRRVLITGGTTGLGRAMALRLSAEGARVFIFGRNPQHLEDAMSDLKENDPDAIGTTADVTKAEDMERIFQQIDSEWGGLDVLINNAAVGADSLEEETHEDREYALLANISGYLRCSRMALERMGRQGHIVLIGSISADEKSAGGSVYVATKSAIQGFAESFRQEAAEKGIKVSLIEPGKTGSDMVEASPEEEREAIKKLEMLRAEDIAVSVEYILTQPPRCTVSDLKIVPTLGD